MHVLYFVDPIFYQKLVSILSLFFFLCLNQVGFDPLDQSCDFPCF